MYLIYEPEIPYIRPRNPVFCAPVCVSFIRKTCESQSKFGWISSYTKHMEFIENSVEYIHPQDIWKSLEIRLNKFNCSHDPNFKQLKKQLNLRRTISDFNCFFNRQYSTVSPLNVLDGSWTSPVLDVKIRCFACEPPVELQLIWAAQWYTTRSHVKRSSILVVDFCRCFNHVATSMSPPPRHSGDR